MSNELVAVDVKGVDFSIGKRKILKGLQFQIKKGSVFAVVGHNGAGKTTFFHILLGIKFQDQGSVDIFGQSNSDWRARSKIGYVLERPYLNLDQELGGFLKYHAKLSGIPYAHADLAHAAEQVGLQGHLEQSLSTFSKGMLQKALLAQASLGDPKMLVLDEPMSGLDPVSREIEKAQIQKWRDMGKTIIFSSHVMEDVEQLADDVMILEAGEMKFCGSVKEWRASR
jgi:ABC-2 type transport system ATP-binding protein